jgi:hypothetical protein
VTVGKWYIYANMPKLSATTVVVYETTDVYVVSNTVVAHECPFAIDNLYNLGNILSGTC